MRSTRSLILLVLLFPLSAILACIVWLRNWLYDRQILKSARPDVFTINVGNLNLGGTGKTPHVEYLVNLLAGQYKLSILSRGYKRATKGFVLADEQANAGVIGDEPMQYFLKFRNRINVAVCEDRVSGVNRIQALLPDNQLIILDDAFQHRKIAPHLNILLCDYSRPFYQDFMVPAGKLRDVRKSAGRADAVIVTKCPEIITVPKEKELRDCIAEYTRTDIPVFFSRIHYMPIVAYADAGVFNTQLPVRVVAAIARPEMFHAYLKEQGYLIEKTVDYPDHFTFSRIEVDAILKKNNPSLQIVTTEKDMVKLRPLLTDDELNHFFYVPIAVQIREADAFNQFVLQKAEDFISENT